MFPNLTPPEIISQILSSAALFILLWAVLGNLVFKPFLAILTEREEKTLGAEKRSVLLSEQCDELNVKLNQELRTARLQAIHLRDVEVEKTKGEGKGIVEKSSIAAQHILESGRDELRQAAQQARTELDKDITVLSNTLLEKILETAGDRQAQ